MSLVFLTSQTIVFRLMKLRVVTHNDGKGWHDNIFFDQAMVWLFGIALIS